MLPRRDDDRQPVHNGHHHPPVQLPPPALRVPRIVPLSDVILVPLLRQQLLLLMQLLFLQMLLGVGVALRPSQQPQNMAFDSVVFFSFVAVRCLIVGFVQWFVVVSSFAALVVSLFGLLLGGILLRRLLLVVVLLVVLVVVVARGVVLLRGRVSPHRAETLDGVGRVHLVASHAGNFVHSWDVVSRLIGSLAAEEGF